MPESVADDIHKYTRERSLSKSDTWIEASTPSIRRWVKEATQAIADETGNDRWVSVSSHDLRRSWATYHLVERQVDVRTMCLSEVGVIILLLSHILLNRLKGGLAKRCGLTEVEALFSFSSRIG